MKKVLNVLRPKPIVLDNGKTIRPPMSKTPFILLILAIAIYFSVQITGFNFETLIKRGDQFFVILEQMFPPNLSYASYVVAPLIETIKMSILGSIIGSTFALPLAILCSVNINQNTWILRLTRFLLSIVRTLPTLVIALIATYIFDLGAFAGTVAISIFTCGIVTKMLYEKIEGIDMGAFEAMEAVGATRLRAFFGAIMPQLLPSYLSMALYSFEINVRYAAILGYVGAGGIGLILNEKIGWREYDRVGTIIVMLFITVAIIEYTSKHIRERLA